MLQASSTSLGVFETIFDKIVPEKSVLHLHWNMYIARWPEGAAYNKIWLSDSSTSAHMRSIVRQTAHCHTTNELKSVLSYLHTIALLLTSLGQDMWPINGASLPLCQRCSRQGMSEQDCRDLCRSTVPYHLKCVKHGVYVFQAFQILPGWFPSFQNTLSL